MRQFLAAGGTPDARMLDTLFDVALRAGEYKVAMQAVRALELTGHQVDKARYRTLLETRLAAGRGQAGPSPSSSSDGGYVSSEGGGGGDVSGHNRTWADYQRRRQQRRRNEHLERLLFWLGFPNSYYASDASESEEE